MLRRQLGCVAQAARHRCRTPAARTLRGSAAVVGRPAATTIVFDKDGTLLDAHALWGPIVRGACSLMPEDDEALFCLLGFDGTTNRFTPTAPFMIEPNSAVHSLLRGAGVDADQFFEHVQAQPLTPATPIVDTRALFARCRAAGLRVAVLSSDDRDSVQAFLAQEEVEPDALHCGDDGRGHKPSAEPLLALAADLDVTPGSMVMVGDSTHDLDCAFEAGAVAVGVLTGVAGRAELGNADVLLESVADIDESLLAEWTGATH